MQGASEPSQNPWEQALWMLLADFLAAAVPILPFVFLPISQARAVSVSVTVALLLVLGIGRARIAKRSLSNQLSERARTKFTRRVGFASGSMGPPRRTSERGARSRSSAASRATAARAVTSALRDRDHVQIWSQCPDHADDVADAVADAELAVGKRNEARIRPVRDGHLMSVPQQPDDKIPQQKGKAARQRRTTSTCRCKAPACEKAVRVPQGNVISSRSETG